MVTDHLLGLSESFKAALLGCAPFFFELYWGQTYKGGTRWPLRTPLCRDGQQPYVGLSPHQTCTSMGGATMGYMGERLGSPR